MRDSRRRIAVVGVAAVLGIPVGIAVGSGGNPAAEQPTITVSPDDPRAMAVEGEAFDGTLPDPAPAPPRDDAKAETINVISGTPPPAVAVKECEADPKVRPDCGLVAALEAGDIPAGRYTTPELESLLQEAGYDPNF